MKNNPYYNKEYQRLVLEKIPALNPLGPVKEEVKSRKSVRSSGDYEEYTQFIETVSLKELL